MKLLVLILAMQCPDGAPPPCRAAQPLAAAAAEAIAILEQLMPLNAGQTLSPASLRNNPWWTMLRGNPRFERLITQP